MICKLLNPKRWWFFFSILWHVFDEQETMFGHYGTITVRVPFSLAWDLAFANRIRALKGKA